MSNLTKKERQMGLEITRVEDLRIPVFDPVLMLKVALEVAKGELLKNVLMKPGMPSMSTVQHWISIEPTAARALKSARELSAMAFEEEAIEIGRTRAKDPGTGQKVRAAEVLMNQLRWSAGRRDPKNFGDQSTTRIVVPVHITTPLPLTEEAAVEAGEKAEVNIYDVEAKVVVPADPDNLLIDQDPDAELVPIKEKKKPGRIKGSRSSPSFDKQVLARTPEERDRAFQEYLAKKEQRKEKVRMRKQLKEQANG